MNAAKKCLSPFIIVFLASLFFAGCSSLSKPTDTENLEDLQALGAYSAAKKSKTDDINSIRLQAIQDIALSLGAQSGLAWRAKQINASLEKSSKELSQIYNFHALLLEHSVLPPVLSEGNQSLNVSDPMTIRLADRTYKIESQARFVTAPPEWRDYLWQNFSKPDVPNSTLLPKNSREKAVWNEYVVKGWQEGVKQADSIYNENLARLSRDYTGMILYRKLYAQGMVSAPYVATTKLGITGDESGMRINDQVLRITALPSLQRDTDTWKPAVSK